MRRPRPSRPRLARDAGLSLVELLITMVIALVVAASTFTFVAGQQRIYETQSRLVIVQQNLAVTSELLVRMVRAAGSGMAGCVRGDSDGLGGEPGAPAPVGPALPLTAAPQAGLRAYLRGQGTLRIPPLWITNGAAGAPDTITVAYGSGGFGSWKDTETASAIPFGKPTSTLKIPGGAGSMFRKDEFVLLFDDQDAPDRGAPFYNDRGCSLFRITDLDGTLTEIQRDSVSDWNPASDLQGADMIPFDYGVGTAVRQMGRLNWIRFAIQPAAGPDTNPALTMQRLDDGSPAQVIAEGIVDLQVAYACDNSPDDGQLREGPDRSTDEWVLNASGEAIPAGCGKPDAIRLTLVARSLTRDILLADSTTNLKPASEDAALATVSDQYRYRTTTTTIYPRN